MLVSRTTLPKFRAARLGKFFSQIFFTRATDFPEKQELLVVYD